MTSNRTRIGLVLTLTLLLGVALGLGRGVAYAADGDLDPSFNGDGLVTTDLLDTSEEARAVTIQPDGKIVAAGYTLISGTNYNFSVARYNVDGSPDTTFGGGDGMLTTDFSGHDDKAYGVAIYPDGRIVVAGTTGPWQANGAYCFAAVRYQPNGDLDTTFNGDGRFSRGFQGDFCGDYEGSAIAKGVAIQPDGKIVLAGYTDHEASPNFGLMRLTPQGALDSSFDGDGKLTREFGFLVDEAHAVTVYEDKILVAGLTQMSGFNYDFALVRYEMDGDEDDSFGAGGVVTTDFFGGDDGALSLAVQPDGKIVAAGAFYSTGQGYDFGVARYMSNGDLDTGFDSDGVQAINFVAGAVTEVAYGVALQPADGKIVVAGYAPVGGVNDFALARLNADGGLDSSFGAGGKMNHDFGGGVALPYGVAVQADGKIVTAGTAYMGEPNSYDYALARYVYGEVATPTPTATAEPTACPIQFPDVPAGSTFYDFVRCLSCRGIVSGYPDGTFGPNNAVTRGQLSKIVSNAAGYNEDHITQSYEDVPIGSTFHMFIERLADRAIVTGYACGGVGEPCGPSNLPFFRPNNQVTRGQTSKIVALASGLPAPPSGTQFFEDVPEGSTFWQWIQALATYGAINGYACGGIGEPCGPGNLPYFRPNNQVTRGQAAKIVSVVFFPGCVTPQK